MGFYLIKHRSSITFYFCLESNICANGNKNCANIMRRYTKQLKKNSLQLNWILRNILNLNTLENYLSNFDENSLYHSIIRSSLKKGFLYGKRHTLLCYPLSSNRVCRKLLIFPVNILATSHVPVWAIVWKSKHLSCLVVLLWLSNLKPPKISE